MLHRNGSEPVIVECEPAGWELPAARSGLGLASGMPYAVGLAALGAALFVRHTDTGSAGETAASLRSNVDTAV